MLPIVHHPGYVPPLRPGHPFPMSKYGYLKDALIARGLLAPGGYLAPKAASAAMISMAHNSDYVDRVFAQRLGAEEVRRIGLEQSDRLLERIRLSSAGTLLAGWLALEQGIACNCAGGSHHAATGHGAGYCIFNDVAVAVRNLQAQGAVTRAMVIDADVHQGDGTAEIFANDPSVFTVSIHAERNFPVRKQVSNLDLGLADGLDDVAYSTALQGVLQQAFAAFQPQIVFYNAGVDVHGGDRLGRLALTDAGIRARDAQILQAARSRGVPVVGVLGGGYGPDPAVLAERHAILFEEAARLAA